MKIKTKGCTDRIDFEAIEASLARCESTRTRILDVKEVIKELNEKWTGLLLVHCRNEDEITIERLLYRFDGLIRNLIRILGVEWVIANKNIDMGGLVNIALMIEGTDGSYKAVKEILDGIENCYVYEYPHDGFFKKLLI